jgi:putative hydrolase of the HAD superfamily
MNDPNAGQNDLLLAFDADDTLWHSENLYHAAQAHFRELMAPYADETTAMSTLHRIEVANLPPYGFGVKAFILSMIEAALELSGGKVSAADIAAMLAAGQGDARRRGGVARRVGETIASLAANYPLMVITKGDLSHQASKLERSGLAQHFRYVEIVADKTAEIYRTLFAKHGIDPRSRCHGRQLAQVGRDPGAGAGRVGCLCALPSHVGARARGTASAPCRTLP